MLNFLEKSTRPNITYAVHNCACFMSNPKKIHLEAIKDIGRYLVLATREMGIKLKPANKDQECYVNAEFCRLWQKNKL